MMLALRETIKSNHYLARVVDFSIGLDLRALKIIAAKTRTSRKKNKRRIKATADFAEDPDRKKGNALRTLINANRP